MKKKKAKPSKALTKEQLVKLYEEFKEKKKEEHEKRVVKYEQGMMERLKDSLEQWRGMCLGSREIPKWIKGKDFEKAYREIITDTPKYTEPTFNEFMESLGEKKGLMDEWENANAEWEKGMVKLMNKQLFSSYQNY